MPTLEEVYEQRLDEGRREDRPAIGLLLLYTGLGMIVLGGIVAFSSTVAGIFGATAAWERWGVGAILAATGMPVAFWGVFVVVPAPKEDKVLTGAGIAVALIGVLLFDYAYPHMWHADNPDLSPFVFAVYSFGSFMMFGALFRSVLDIEIPLPRSSISLEYTDGGTKTNRENPGSPTDGRSGGEVGSTAGTSTPLDMGGGDAEFVENNAPERSEDRGPSPGFSGDKYCGNCAFYDFVTEDGTRTPYCEHHEEELDDLEACDEHRMRLNPEAEDH